jgi:hypothetical protein
MFLEAKLKEDCIPGIFFIRVAQRRLFGSCTWRMSRGWWKQSPRCWVRHPTGVPTDVSLRQILLALLLHALPWLSQHTRTYVPLPVVPQNCKLTTSKQGYCGTPLPKTFVLSSRKIILACSEKGHHVVWKFLPLAGCTFQDKLCSTLWQVLEHSSYNADLSPFDFHVLGLLEKALRVLRFGRDEDVVTATAQWFQ